MLEIDTRNVTALHPSDTTFVSNTYFTIARADLLEAIATSLEGFELSREWEDEDGEVSTKPLAGMRKVAP